MAYRLQTSTLLASLLLLAPLLLQTQAQARKQTETEPVPKPYDGTTVTVDDTSSNQLIRAIHGHGSGYNFTFTCSELSSACSAPALDKAYELRGVKNLAACDRYALIGATNTVLVCLKDVQRRGDK